MKLSYLWLCFYAVTHLYLCIGCQTNTGMILEQVEYAHNAVKSGGSSMSMRSDDYAIHVTLRSKRAASDMGLISSPTKVHQLSERMGVSLTGVVGDAHNILQIIFSQILSNKQAFGLASKPSAMRLSSTIANHIGEKTMGVKRPVGVSLCFIAYESHLCQCRIYEVDSYGVKHDCKLCCLGKYASQLTAAVKEPFMKLLKESRASLSDLLQLSISSIGACKEVVEEMDIDLGADLDVYIVGKDVSFQQIDQALLRQSINANDYKIIERSLLSSPLLEDNI